MASTASEKRERAPRLSPDQRRSALVETAVTLLTEHGGGFTTAQLAEAAQVSEGTIFRYFPDKGSLLDACQRQVMGLDRLLPALREAAALPALEARLHRAADDIAAHLERAGQVIAATKAAHHDHHQDPPVELLRELLDAVADLFTGHAGELRLTRQQLATAFVGSFLSNTMLSRAAGVAPVAPATLVTTFLHGVARP